MQVVPVIKFTRSPPLLSWSFGGKRAADSGDPDPGMDRRYDGINATREEFRR